MKRFFNIIIILLSVGIIASCSTNTATGERQFTAFLPESSEAKVGAENHQKILAQFGYYDNPEVQAYVNRIGQELVKGTEREGVNYTFTVIDSPIVNAFAVPGGYIYISRGLMALANDEAELASVIGHEIGHITARHSAQQQSKGILANIGLTVLSVATDLPTGAGRAAALGTDLYLKSYSRKHEHQADELGMRYIHRAGYNPYAASEFLAQLDREATLEAKIKGQEGMPQISYFATHPITSERIARTEQIAAQYPTQQTDDRKITYFNKIDELTYGESPSNGFVRGQRFIHTELGFLFDFPDAFEIANTPTRVVGRSDDFAIIFDGARKEPGQPIADYVLNTWKQGGKGYAPVEAITINGMPAATTYSKKKVSGKASLVRDVAIDFDGTQIYRFTVVMPENASAQKQEEMKRATYSFRKLTKSDYARYKPRRVKVFAAREGDSIFARAGQTPFDDYKQERFRVLNGLNPNQNLVANRLYKTIVE